MPPPVGSNWEMFVEEQVLHGPEEIDLRTARSGDCLTIVTKNTRYEFEWRDDGRVLLRTDRADRPWGLVTLVGCAFRRSGIVAPDVVFRGGKLEYVSMDGQVRHRTTVIASVELVRRGTGAGNTETAQAGMAR